MVDLPFTNHHMSIVSLSLLKKIGQVVDTVSQLIFVSCTLFRFRHFFTLHVMFNLRAQPVFNYTSRLVSRRTCSSSTLRTLYNEESASLDFTPLPWRNRIMDLFVKQVVNTTDYVRLTSESTILKDKSSSFLFRIDSKLIV